MMGRRRSRSFPGIAAAAAVLLALTPVASLAQTPLGPGDALRPLYANAEDIRDGKALADTACAGCHGPEGISTTDGVPHLAGQRPSYLYRELKAYQFGDRLSGGNDVHNTRLMKSFSDEALSGLAAYYASLDPAPPPQGAAPKFEDPVASGEAASGPCAKCHGEAGVSRKQGVPSLVGLDPKYLVESMKAYKEGDRPVDEKNAEMKKALDALGEADLKRIAIYYALQKDNLTRAQTPGPGGPPAGKDALSACAKCHGENGIGSGPVNPSLAGQDATYMLNALRAYKNTTRDDEVMTPKVKTFSDDQLRAFAVYYAGLDPKPLGIPKPLGPDEWAEKCDRCHGINGNSVRPEVPALAGQRAGHLERALKAYRSGARTSPEMAAMTSILTDDDIEGLAAHYAYQKGRPVVFVPVPEK